MYAFKRGMSPRITLITVCSCLMTIGAAAQSRPTILPRPNGPTSRPAATRPAAPRVPLKPGPPTTTQPINKSPRIQLLPVGSFAPHFESWTINQQYVRFPEDYAGQLVLLHVWASWCPSCARDYPYWVKAQAQYGNQGLTLLGVSLDYQHNILPDAVQQAMIQRGGTWEVICEDAPKLERMLRTPSLPTLYLVDGDTGKILEAGDALRRGRLMDTLARHMHEKFPDRFPATQPASAPASQPVPKP